jgi:GntR family transcriptional repressor for pyruvate dehydrogenase complex
MDDRMLTLVPTQRVPLSQKVLDQLLSRIRDGSIRPGDRLPGEYELMRQLDVGRSSVREALRGLITLGLVETKAGRGAVVLEQPRAPLRALKSLRQSIGHLQKSAVLDLLEVRESLEGRAATLAAQRATPTDVAAIVQAAEEVERCIARGVTYFRANMEFHVAVARASHNSTLAESLRYLLREVRGYRERLMREIIGMADRDMAEHREIVEAIRQGKAAGARRAMMKHLRSFAALVQTFEPSGSRRAVSTRRTKGSANERLRLAARPTDRSGVGIHVR